MILPLSSWVFFPNSPPHATPSNAPETSSSLPLYWNWIGPSPGVESAERQMPPVYPYSVIPGGVRNGQELLAAARNDAVVAAHYRDFRMQSAWVLRLNTARQAYVSYRTRDHIYWTSKKVMLHAGETLLTDGEHFARTRCGNRIAETPLGPSSPSEPPVETLDRPVTPHSPDALPVDLPAGPLVPYDPTPFLVALNLPGYSPSPEPLLPFAPLFPCCGGGSHPTIAPKSPPLTPTPIPEPSSSPNPLPQPSPFPPPPVVTPEPGSILLLLVGVAGLFCLWALRRS